MTYICLIILPVSCERSRNVPPAVRQPTSGLFHSVAENLCSFNYYILCSFALRVSRSVAL